MTQNLIHQSQFSELLKQIKKTKVKIFTNANTDLIELYWQVGKTISNQVKISAWGKSVVSELAKYIIKMIQSSRVLVIKIYGV